MRLESEIQKAILLWLNVQPKTFAFRTNNTGIYNMKTRTWRKAPMRGCADILCCKNGDFIALEVKREGKRVEPHQRRWLERVDKAGGKAYIVHSLEDAQAVWIQS